MARRNQPGLPRGYQHGNGDNQPDCSRCTPALLPRAQGTLNSLLMRHSQKQSVEFSQEPMKTLSQILRLLVLTNLIAAAQAQDISVPDPGLNAAIREALQKPAGPLTAQDLLSLTNLSAAGRRASSLEGLETAYNLTGLDLYHNYLTNVTVLGGLTNLTDLNLGGNQLTTLTLPAGLKNLTTLNLRANQLTGVALPAGLTNLTSLELSFNN